MRRSEYRAVLAYFGAFPELQGKSKTLADAFSVATTCRPAPAKRARRKHVATDIVAEGGRD